MSIRRQCPECPGQNDSGGHKQRRIALGELESILVVKGACNVVT